MMHTTLMMAMALLVNMTSQAHKGRSTSSFRRTLTVLFPSQTPGIGLKSLIVSIMLGTFMILEDIGYQRYTDCRGEHESVQKRISETTH